MPLFVKIWLLVGFVVWVAEFAAMAEALEDVEDPWKRAVIGTVLSTLCVLFWPKVMHLWVRRDLAAAGLWTGRPGTREE